MVKPLGATLDDVTAALDTAIAWSVFGAAVPTGMESVSMIDADDLASGTETIADLVILVGVDRDRLLDWLAGPATSASERRVHVVLTKAFADLADAQDAAARFGVAVVGVHTRARWDQVLGLVQAAIERSPGPGEGPGGATDVDLFGLVGLVAGGTGGLVSIEDATSARVLAYSPSNGEADDLRMQTILGREGPPAYLALLRKWGVFDAIRRGSEVVDVPEHPDHEMRRRLVVGVHSHAGRHLGSIWVQEGSRPLADDAVEVLRGAAAIAARILTREMQAPSTEAQLVQRMFGEHGGVDASTAAAYLRWPEDEQVAVVGFALAGGDPAHYTDVIDGIGGALRLHASAFASAALTTVIGEHAYVVLPMTAAESITRWARSVVTRFDGDSALAARAGDEAARLHAAVVAPIHGLASVPVARSEVDRVLAAVSAAGLSDESRVTTLAQARTAVLLGEIMDVLAAADDLVDPRIAGLAEYDSGRDSQLVESVRAYLDAHGNIREAARRIGIHANTLRYRIERAQQLSGLSFDDPGDRLLTTLQLAMRSRRETR